jgi:ankyrin repeat protein
VQTAQGDYAHLLADAQGHKSLSIYIAEFGVTMSMLGDDAETMMSMIRHGANVNVENENGWTALTFFSARTNDSAAVK